MVAPTQAAQQKLDRFLSYLEHDPDNPALLRDAAEAALAANATATAARLYDTLAAIEPLSDADMNMAAIAAMQSGDQATAQHHFTALLARNPDDDALKFNLAWSLALAGDNEAALALLDESATSALPQAAMLDVQLRHAAGEFEEAEAAARAHLRHHGDYPPFLAAVSVLAMDVEDEELARDCAIKAGNVPDALTTLATLTLGDQNSQEARALFEQALEHSPNAPRALIGLGLTDLAEGDYGQAVRHLDRGAALFEDHLGSWIAAGWGYFVSGDYATARARFQTALELDDNFAESHGSLAVMDILDGDIEGGKHRLEIARRLDRNAFAPALAQMLLAAADGNEEKAQQIMALALKQPLDAKGRTLADALGKLALGRG